jgi:hypothetical protein
VTVVPVVTTTIMNMNTDTDVIMMTTERQ